jgi:hypothetical protein
MLRELVSKNIFQKINQGYFNYAILAIIRLI